MNLKAILKTKNVKLSLEGRKSLYGWIFVIPWVIGFLLFFFKPMVNSFWYSFNNLQITTEGIKTEFVKLTHWKYIFLEHSSYTMDLSDAIEKFLYTLPIIVFLSVCIGIVLNQNFKGRFVARAVFFIPAIVASGVVMELFANAGSTMNANSSANNFFASAIDFNSVITGLGLPDSITELLTSYVTQISTLIWSCGLQIILVLSGLQSISPQLYEVAKIEGATAWETF